ncbi:hypothetical protein GCM10028801_44560 [Nocardioides maradonensis]
MPASDDDYETPELYSELPEPEARRRPAEVPVVVTGDLPAAETALERAQDAVDTAQDTLADLEGRIAVLEVKAAAIEADEGKEEWQRAAAREELAKARRAFTRAGRKLERAEHKLETAARRVDAETEALMRALSTPAQPDPEPEPARFATVDLFVEKFVLPNWVHKYVAERVRWCDHWWEHAEAITRLEAIWEAFELMRLQPAPSFSTWLRDHFDVHMRTLTDPDGVFHKCDMKKVDPKTGSGYHNAEPTWPSAPVPVGMFAEIETAQIQRGLAAAGALSGAVAGADASALTDTTLNSTITKHSNATTSGARR